MLYFQPHALPADESLVAAWDSQLVELSRISDSVEDLESAELFPRFAVHYSRLRALPRGARRSLMRRLLRARESAWPHSLGAPLRRRLARSAAGAALLLALAQGAQAATINVTTNTPDIHDGDGKCSLIEAIINANDDAATHPDCAAGSGADTIVLPKKKPHVLTSSYVDFYGPTGLPVIQSDITIEGNGATITRSKRAEAFRIFAVDAAILGDLTLNNLTISAGSTSDEGGGILARGFLTLNNSVVSGNTASAGGGISGVLAGVGITNSAIIGNIAVSSGYAALGGGILGRLAPIEVINSTISGNKAIGGDSTGAIGGGITIFSTLNIENSTISGNSAIAGSGAGASGGGVNVIEEQSFIAFGIRNSTITGNTASGGSGGSGRGGGISTGQAEGPRGLLRNTIVSGNAADVGPEIAGIFGSTGYDLFGNNGDAGVYGFTPASSDIVPNVALKQILGPLKNNGGPTATHALVPGSPAIDAVPVNEDCPATDQRGITRPQGAACDIGAFEFNGKGKGKGKNK